MNECRSVQRVFDLLATTGTISTITPFNIELRVGAGGFQGDTTPAFVLTYQDSGPGAASAADIEVISNALGYVLSQGSTTHFAPDRPAAYDFPLDYAVVRFRGALTGLEAKAFFDHLGTIDPALWSGEFAGFTQIDFQTARTNNAMLFLQPAAPLEQFRAGLFAAAADYPRVTYFPLDSDGQPLTGLAGVAFPGNDWVAHPDGADYLAKIPGATPYLLGQLRSFRQLHLMAVRALVDAVHEGRVGRYLDSSPGRFCPVPR